VILAHGDAGRQLSYSAVCAGVLLACMAIGGYRDGAMGVIVGAVAAELVNHVVLLGYVRKYGVWTPWFDAGVLTVCALVICMGLALT
jgi:hypothetical protein